MKQNVIVTIGPTQEPLDAMRILSNRSTGELGTQLAITLAKNGHRILALRGIGATAVQTELYALGITIHPFATTEDLRCLFEQISKSAQIDAIFHAAAVSDFYLPGAGHGKLPTDNGSLTLTLQPTPKIIPLLRGWFPKTKIIGWKFEASGNKATALSIARHQIVKNQTDACVLNGPSYGEGFGLLTKDLPIEHLSNREELCNHLSSFLTTA